MLIFALAPWITLALFLVPVIAGLVWTVLPAFGYLPALGGDSLSLAPWRTLFAYPGFPESVRLTVSTGLSATVLAFLLTVLLAAALHETRAFRWLRSATAPILATPHAAVAIGLAFLIAPSGWVVRLLSPWTTGFAWPPDVVIVRDPWGLSLVGGLLLKETPYLFLMTLGALNQVRAEDGLRVARSLGYGPVTAWIKVVLPQVYPQLRLPLFAVLAFSLSVVDVALILGPNNPPPLATLVFRWFNQPDLSLYFPAAAGACLQGLIVLGAIALWIGSERLVRRLGRRWVEHGSRGGPGVLSRGVAGGVATFLVLTSALSVAGMAVWSLTGFWRFPDALPALWTLDNWVRHWERLWWPGETTLIVGGAATLCALALTVLCLENEQVRSVRVTGRSLWLLYAPLLVPQIAFLMGAQIALVGLNLDGTWLAVIWAHLLFVLPYAFLSLVQPWRTLDPRYARAARSLGAGPWRVLLRVKIPMLLRPLLIAAAVGFAVSAGQYLPTLFAGAGRFATLTTEAVTLAAGGDRRVMGVYTFAQSLVPLLVYAVALATPILLYRHRRALRG